MKLCLFLFSSLFGDAIYQNRLGNNRMIASLRQSATQPDKASLMLDVMAELVKKSGQSNVRKTLRRMMGTFRKDVPKKGNKGRKTFKGRLANFNKRHRQRF